MQTSSILKGHLTKLKIKMVPKKTLVLQRIARMRKVMLQKRVELMEKKVNMRRLKTWRKWVSPSLKKTSQLQE